MSKQYLELSAIKDIEKWAHDRNLIAASNPERQALKLVSEIGELAKAVAEDDREEQLDGLGDAIVVATIIAAQYGENLVELAQHDVMAMMLPGIGLLPYMVQGQLCDAIAKGNRSQAVSLLGCLVVSLDAYAMMLGLNLMDGVRRAYGEIKDRKGIMYQGVFIKSDDERYADAVAEVNAARSAEV